METVTTPPSPSPSIGLWNREAGRTPVAVLMSGGVDSSVAALLLREAGLDAVGVTMLVPTTTGSTSCCGAHAATVCRDLGIPHYTLDVRAAFRSAVLRPFRDAYTNGETPNPCIYCNTRLKFDLVAAACRQHLGITDLATGHYARVYPTGDGIFLARARQRSKDQSYFIYGVPAALLPHLHLPLGDLAKDAVRERAHRAGLHVAGRAESQEFCFAGDDYRTVLAGDLPGAGPIVDPDGRKLGTHRGLWNYTVGQRHGLGIGTHEPHWVLGLDPEGNRLIVGQRRRAYARRVVVRPENILQPDACRPDAPCRAKVRSVGEPAGCRVVTATATRLELRFDAPVFAPAPGQHCVLYDHRDRVIAGGGIVRRPDRS